MPNFATSRSFSPPDWKTMTRWQRKEFHRENESRARKGLAALKKPRTARVGIDDLFYKIAAV
jgi:hypothetical protein